MNNYNPLERRESCKGGKELGKKPASSQPLSKSSAAVPKHPSHNGRRTDVPNASVGNQSSKTARPSSSGGSSSQSESEKTLYEQQIIELKISVDTLEKERDYYFAMLRDIEIFCQNPEIENSLAVEAIKRILYGGDDDPLMIEEAQAMISKSQQQVEQLDIIPEEAEEKLNADSQKRKTIINVDVDAASGNSSSPRQRISEASDVHCSESPVISY